MVLGRLTDYVMAAYYAGHWLLNGMPKLGVGDVMEFIERPEKDYYNENFEHVFSTMYEYELNKSQEHFFYKVTKALIE